MSLSNLATQEIEKRIDQFIERKAALKGIISEINVDTAKVTLQRHLDDYETSLDALRKELAKRNKKIN